jgi:hypothetical protein
LALAHATLVSHETFMGSRFMMPKMFYRRVFLVLVLIAMPFLAGSQCAIFFSSGGDDNEEDKEDEVIVVAAGNLGDTPVAGVDYVSGSISGVTGSDGGFQYEPGKTVQFSIGDISLGRAVAGKSVITPVDLVADGAIDTPAVINIERLLQSLDAAPGDAAITIPSSARAKAVRSNATVASAIEYLDFSDDDAFANAASQLVTVLTGDYPFTGVLVDAETAQRSLSKSM